jgi:putative flavoprotein involved in K+ transport
MNSNIAPYAVLVIGAGPAGIVSAYHLHKQNISYVVYDRAKTIGSTWHSLYPSLRLNTTRFYSHLPELKFPWRDGFYPTGKQYFTHLQTFVQKHHLNIRLGVDVIRVSAENGLWRVETSQGIEYFQAVVSATGIFNNPSMPKIDGMETFEGCILHAKDFVDPYQVTNQRVLVVGNGPSGVDIAVASSHTAKQVAIAIRNGIMMKPRYPRGLPGHAWMMLADILPKAWCKALMSWVSKAGYGDTSALGLKPPTDKGSITSYQGRDLIDAVRAKKVQPVSAPIRFCGRHVELADGTTFEADTIIMATGYEPVLHKYLDIPMQFSEVYFEATPQCEWVLGGNGQRGFPLLDRSTHPNGREILGHKGIYVVGVWYKGKGAMYNINQEARIMAEQVKAYLA